MASTSTTGIDDAGKGSVDTKGGQKHSRSTLRTVVTAPPWAKDEPESPVLGDFPVERHPSNVSTSRAPSTLSNRPSLSTETIRGHHRWTFALPRPRPLPKPKRRHSSASSSMSINEVSIEERPPTDSPSRASRPRWPTPRKITSDSTRIFLQPGLPSPSRPSKLETLRLQLPLPQPIAPFTISHSRTPGWNTPWTPRIPDQSSSIRDNTPRTANEMDLFHIWTNRSGSGSRVDRTEKSDEDGLSRWSRMKKKLRYFFLRNYHIPLVSRLINLSFTTLTLALAIRIRLIEQENHLRGAVGSSPVLAIIFTPLTLVHVMIAIYLEYFGRPLGLWRTSAKLAHTLSEVLFICAWSAELSLCFDNYFTSPLQCAPHSAVSWYSELPLLSNPLGNNATGDLLQDAQRLCAYQLDLIGVVMVALLLYCINLIISLFRIFEKVKVHQGLGPAR